MWERLYRRAYELALEHTPGREALEELLTLAELDRGALDIARLHFVGHLGDRPDDDTARQALGYLDGALSRGDRLGSWRRDLRRVDPWAIAQHRLLDWSA
ncbi:MAG: hypothetical protein JWP02_3584 [Acidimicrobiales bacterium]|nr:hypothetical protein [Acidimicrobiales bacterium]